MIYSESLIRIMVFVFLMTSSVGVFAQTLTAANVAPVPGDEFYTEGGPYYSPGPGGQGQLWDFSNYVPDGISTYSKFFSAAGLTSDSNDLRYHSNQYFQRGNFAFYEHLDGNALSNLGDGSYRCNFSSYSDNGGVLILKFPFHFNDSCNKSTMFFTSSGSYVTWYSVATTMLADGTGTLVTPCGTYNQIVRIRRRVVTVTAPSNVSSSSHYTHDTTITYEWYQPGVHSPVLTISTLKSYNYWMGTYYRSGSTIYSDPSKPLGIRDLNVTSPAMVFQNPVNEILPLTRQDGLRGIVTMTIMDASGNKVIEQQLMDDRVDVNVSALAPGLYTISFLLPDWHYEFKKLMVAR